MQFFSKRLSKFTFLSAAAYIFLFALIAKGVFIYASQHPSKEELVFVDGIVQKKRIGGNGNSTSFQIKSDNGTHVYSSYYGKVWPGMRNIAVGDRVMILAERNKLNRNEFVTGRRYYIWELVHNDRYIVRYDDIFNLVTGKENTANRYATLILVASGLFLLIAYIRKLHVGVDGK